MKSLLDQLRHSPVAARIAPFLVVVALTAGQGLEFLGPTGRFWIYFGKTLLGAALLAVVWPVVTEMRWKFSGAAVVVGIGVFVLWVGLDPLLQSIGLRNSYPKVSVAGAAWRPLEEFAATPALGWFFVCARIAGSSLVVPPLEEVFYRSFLYRYLQKADFVKVPLERFVPVPFLVAAVVFGLAHREWLAGVLCAFAYQGLVCWKRRLGDAMTAHAITNFLLGIWVVWKGAWEFW